MVKKEKTETLVEPGEVTVSVDWSAQPSRTVSPWFVAALSLALAILIAALTGCSGSSRVPGGPVPASCYTRALQAADEAALKQCGGVWSMCEHRASILAELDRQLEACDVVSDER
jgi:hypothetical protein